MIEINPSTYKNLRWKRADFIPVIKGIETPLVLVANPSVPAKTHPSHARCRLCMGRSVPAAPPGRTGPS
jgi:hypothetical protein